MKAVLLPAFGQGRLVPVFRLPCRMLEEVFEPALNIVRPWRTFLTFRIPWLTPCPECVRLRQACPGFPPAGAAYGPDSQKTDKHPAACNRLPSAGDTAKLSKKETGSCEPVPFIFRCCKNLFGCDNDNLDVSEDALVALHLALELTELLDVGNGDVLALDLDACGCENLGNLG